MKVQDMIKLATPYFTHAEFRTVDRVLRSGQLVQARVVEQFEEDLCRRLGVKQAVAVSSGTAALHLALLSLGIGPGDEVIVPAFTFPATANVVEITGARPVFVDIDLRTFNLDVRLLSKAITPKTRAIMPVHQFGLSADMTIIMKIAKARGLKVLEDAACALGARYGRNFCGTIGDVGCFSFHPRKVITTGEGGAVVTNDPALARQLRLLRAHGMIRTTGRWPDLVTPGLNYRMTEIQAALGTEQLKKLGALIRDRQRIAKLYEQHLSALPLTLPASGRGRHIYQSYVILVPKSVDRDRVVDQQLASGIETTLGSYAVPMLTYYRKKYRIDPCAFPQAQEACARSLSLPMPFRLTNKDIRFIATELNKPGRF